MTGGRVVAARLEPLQMMHLPGGTFGAHLLIAAQLGSAPIDTTLS